MYIDHTLQRALSDRIYDKRKPAALQLEQVVRKAIEQDNMELVEGVITELSRDFAYALRHPNYRNGGLIGLAGVAIALGQEGLPSYLDDIIQPILACFGDADARVRYYACESLYNVAKIAKGEILAYFNEIFDALCKLTADIEESVRNGANLVDQLLRDIVVETASTYLYVVNNEPPLVPSPVEQPEGPEGPTLQKKLDSDHRVCSFSLDRFIPLLVERIYVLNPATRMFLVQWITLLDSIPDIELIKFLPQFLEGLLLFLTDTHKDVRVFTKTCLEGLLNEIKSIAKVKHKSSSSKSEHEKSGKSGVDAGLYEVGQDTVISYAEILDILLGKMDPLHDETQLVILDWIEGILDVSPSDVLAKLSSLISVLLPALNDEQSELRKKAGKSLNEKLLGMLAYHSDVIESAAAVKALGKHLESDEKVTRLAALNWLTALYSSSKRPNIKLSSSSSYDDLLVKLLAPLGDPSDKVVSQDLELLGLILRDTDRKEFKFFVKKLVEMFESSQQLFSQRGKFICLQLCLHLSPERVFRAIAEIVGGQDNGGSVESEFKCLLIQNLNSILLTAPELHNFRNQLTQLNTEEGIDLFTKLFQSWKRNSVATLALCLLAQAYDRAYDVLEIIAAEDLTVSTLIRIDKLVQLLEGPVFAPLRMHLLQPARHHYLYKTLYGLLMVLPQSKAFTVLQTRLGSVSAFAQLPSPAFTASKRNKNEVDWQVLLRDFSLSYKRS